MSQSIKSAQELASHLLKHSSNIDNSNCSAMWLELTKLKITTMQYGPNYKLQMADRPSLPDLAANNYWQLQTPEPWFTHQQVQDRLLWQKIMITSVLT